MGRIATRKLLLHGIRWLLYRNGPAASVIVEGGGFFQTEEATRPDLQIHIAPAMVVRGGQTRLDGHGFTINSTFLRPRSIGSVTLVRPIPPTSHWSTPTISTTLTIARWR